jgi:hypothetical protein
LVVWKVVVGTGTWLTTLKTLFSPSAALSRGEAKSRTSDSFCMKRAKSVEGMLVTKSERFSEEST